MQIIKTKISLNKLDKLAKNGFGNLVKAVVDIKKGIMVIDGELHSDEEALLLENGSNQENLWGINIYPDVSKDQRIEFDSMINLRLFQNNNTRSVDDPRIREKIIKIVNDLLDE